MAELPIRIQPNSTILLKTQESFPTPSVENRILVEYIPMETGSWEIRPYGTTLYESIEHTSFSKDYTGYFLVSQKPAFDNNNWFMQYVWAKEWVSQEEWNYSFAYAESDPDYPTVTRLLTVRRDTYAPLEPLTPDPNYPDALLTEEHTINQTDPSDLHSEFIQVVRTYTTLPGPVVLTQDFDTELAALVWTDRQVVLSTDEFDPSSELLTMAMQESPITKYTKLRIWSYLQELPATYTEYNTGNFRFPSLVYSITADVLQLTLDPDRSQVRWYPTHKAAPQVPAIFQTITSFYTSSPSVPALYAIGVRDLIYNGIAINVNMGSVLSDEISFTVSFTDDSNYGDLSESHTFAATTPTATEYTADIGTYQTVSLDIKRYRGNIWILQNTKVLLL